MRTSALLISATLAAGILSHPFHLSHKRQHDGKGNLVKSYVKGNTLIQEYETVRTQVVAPQGQDQQSQVLNVQHGGDNNKKVQEPEPQPSPPETQVKAQTEQKQAQPPQKHEQQPQVQQKQQQPQDQKPASTDDSSKNDNKPTSGGSCTGEASGGDVWSGNTCSGGKSILDTFNDMRKQWDPSLSPYTWSDKLAKNARDTVLAPDAMNKASVMKHKLFPGSMGQCIAGSSGKSSGDQSAFAAAVEMWICEIPKGYPCKKQTAGIGDNPTGHAKIIGDNSKTQFGCWGDFKNSDPSSGEFMFDCDFA